MTSIIAALERSEANSIPTAAVENHGRAEARLGGLAKRLQPHRGSPQIRAEIVECCCCWARESRLKKVSTKLNVSPGSCTLFSVAFRTLPSWCADNPELYFRFRAVLLGSPGASMPVTQRLTVPKHVVGEVLDGETFLLNLTTGVYFGLNQTGTRVWQLIAAQVDLPNIALQLAKEFDAEPQAIRSDVERLIEKLRAQDLLSFEAGGED